MSHQYPKRYQNWKRRKGKPTDERSTPQDFFDRLDGRFKFNLDVAATYENKKCDRYYDQNMDGLSLPWSISEVHEAGRDREVQPARVWCNPPYSDIPSWIMKAHEEFRNGNAEVIVMLLPADTSTDWFHDLLLAGPHRLNFIYLRGRLKFEAADNGAKFPSMLVVWEKPLTA